MLTRRNLHLDIDPLAVTDMADEPTVQEPTAPDETIIIVHGTFSGLNKKGSEKGSARPWYGVGSDFCRKLDSKLAECGSPARCWSYLDHDADLFHWSGTNSWIARSEAAIKLAGLIATQHAKGRKSHIVAHSHGGNVVLEALSSLGKDRRISPGDLGAITTLGTPFFFHDDSKSYHRWSENLRTRQLQVITHPMDEAIRSLNSISPEIDILEELGIGKDSGSLNDRRIVEDFMMTIRARNIARAARWTLHIAAIHIAVFLATFCLYYSSGYDRTYLFAGGGVFALMSSLCLYLSPADTKRILSVPGDVILVALQVVWNRFINYLFLRNGSNIIRSLFYGTSGHPFSNIGVDGEPTFLSDDTWYSRELDEDESKSDKQTAELYKRIGSVVSSSRAEDSIDLRNLFGKIKNHFNEFFLFHNDYYKSPECIKYVADHISDNSASK